MDFMPGFRISANKRITQQTDKQPDKSKISTPLDVSVTLSAESQAFISQQLVTDYNSFPMSDYRMRYELLDLAYYMENSEHLRRTRASRILQGLYEELELPVLQPNIDAAHAFMVGVFLSARPIFPVVSDTPELTPAGKQIEAIIAENSTQTGWARQLNLALKDGLKYNAGAIDVEWITRQGFKFITDTNVSFTEATVEDTLRAGNEIKHKNMYNTFYDSTVALADVHKMGDYAGEVTRLTLAQLHQYITDLSSNSGTVMNVRNNATLWNSTVFHNWYYEPELLSEDTVHSGTDWRKFFYTSNNKSGPMTTHSQATFERIIFHRRIIPSIFHMNVPDKDRLQLWKFVEVNGVIIYAERKTTAHQLMPTIFFQPIEDGNKGQTKGLGSILKPYQNLSGTFYKARIASLARALSDRALYDPSIVSEADVNSVIPTAKIPLRPSAYGGGMEDAYKPIPYDDRNSAQLLHQDIAFIDIQANKAAHQNAAQKGQFTKGNRTEGEFDEIMLNANAPQQAMALLLELQAFTPMKSIIKINILQYQGATDVENPNTNELVTVDPVELRKNIVNFKLADGLVTEAELLGTQESVQAFQVLLNDPQAQLEFNLTGMMVEALDSGNARLTKWRRTPEEQKQITDRRIAQAQAENGQPQQQEPQQQAAG